MRRSAMVLLAAALALTASAPATSRKPRAAAARPNVLLIVTDDQTPLDGLRVLPQTRRWFRRGGTRFPNAFVTTPLCCPSRGSIFTGRYAHNHRVLDNQQAFALDHDTTVQHALREAGYLTALTGKFFNGWPTELAPPNFDRWAMFSPLEFSAGYRDAWFNLDGQVRQIARYSTDVIAARSLGILRSFEAQDERPWLLVVMPFAPHGPHTPAKRHRKARVPRWRPAPNVFEADRSDKPAYVRGKAVKPGTIERVRRRSLQSLMAVDDLVGRVMRELRRLGEADTLAFFLSDNGYTQGDHGWIDKRLPYTSSIKIPLLMRWPGRVPAGEARPGFVTNVDLVPTILQAAGVPPVTEMDGRSLLGPVARDHLSLEYWTNAETTVPGWRAIRTPAVHYIEYPDDATGEIVFREYYDLVSDPYQLENLLGDADPSNDPPADEVAMLSNQIARDARCRGTEGPDACP